MKDEKGRTRRPFFLSIYCVGSRCFVRSLPLAFTFFTMVTRIDTSSSTSCRKADIKLNDSQCESFGAFSSVSFHCEVLLFVIGFHPSSFILPSSLQQLAQRMRQHLSPPGPVMIDVMSPDIQCVRNSFGGKDVGECAAAFRRFV